jgi:uroporphyrinogen-III decarboxylase
MRDIDREKPGGWRADPGFVEMARMVQEYCDPHPLWSPVPPPRVFSQYSYQRFLEAPEQYVEQLPPQRLSSIRTRYKYVLHTPKGDLTWAYDEDEGVETRWDITKPITTLEDVDRMLSVPYKFNPPAASAFDAHRKYRAEMGADAIGGANINSMVAMLCGVMDYELMLEWLLSEPAAIRTLADAWLDRTRRAVDYLLDQGAGPMWHFNGVERACPPMMSPRQWDEWVVAYDGAIMRQIKTRDPKALIHVHCHGKVGTLLKSFMETGVDSTDPVEPPPQGDIEMASARKIVGDRMVLFGNMEFLDMETRTPDEIEQLIRCAIEQSGKKRVVLYPSATPHERHTPKLLANARRYIEAALRYGAC